MKKFIAICIFAIGMFVVLPSTSSGSYSPPPDQVSFVADMHQAVQAYEIQSVTIEPFVSYELQALKSPVCTAENVVQKNPDFNKFYLLNHRTCISTTEVQYHRKFLLQHNAPNNLVRIRDDTSI